MDDQKRIASKRSGDDFGDTKPAIQYFLDDHLGSSSVVLDSAGSLINREEYYPFGETSFGSFAKKRYRFCGKERDEESGLYYYGARYYAPWVCRFVSVDPLAEKMMEWSPYSYAFNNAIKLVDKDGRIPAIPLLLKAGTNAAADWFAQTAMNYYFNPETAGNWSASAESVNGWQIARSGFEGLIPWKTPGGRIGRAALTAIGDVSVNYLNDISSYSTEQAVQDFAVGFVGDLAGGGLGEIVSKYGAKSVANGLLNLGFDTKFIREVTGGLNNKEVRSWYSTHVKKIDINVDPTEANARMIVGQRNTLKQQARDLMSDRKAAKALDQTNPIQSFDYYYNKYFEQGYRGTDLNQRIIHGGTTPNADVNKKFGID